MSKREKINVSVGAVSGVAAVGLFIGGAYLSSFVLAFLAALFLIVRTI